jgi:soluble lytic murein transglycosylase-like protein
MTKKNRVIGVFLVVAVGIMAGDVIKSRLSNTLPEIVSRFPRFTFTRQPSITNPSDNQPPRPTSPGPSEIHQLIQEAARKNGVSAAFVKSVVAAESNFNAGAISPKGAIGLMQLMPETARQYGADPSNPQQNIDAGTRYLKVLMNRYRKSRNPLAHAIAAYNAGPGVVDRYRGLPPYRETRAYVVRVMGFLRQFERDQKKFKFGRPSGPELATVLR